MKIAVNTRLLLKGRLEGIGRFSYEVLSRMVKNHPEHEFYFLFDRPWDKEFVFAPNVIPVSVFPQARHPFLFIWWFEFSLPRFFRKIKPDVFLSPDGYASIRTNIPTVDVIHDINFEHFPEHVPMLARHHYRYYFPRYARKSTQIITVSEFTKQDVVQKYKVNPDKIDVAWNGVSSMFTPCCTEEIVETRKKYSSGQPYFLYVGSLHPRKNLRNLMKAFEIFKKQQPFTYKLVIAGQAYWGNEEMEKIYKSLNCKEDIVFTGRIDNETLRQLYGSAYALTYVSLFEGFGLPIVEAMNCDVPVICSNTTSMPEVGGDAVILVDPESPDSIAKAMSNLYNDEGLRKDLIEKGRQRRKMFSWDKTAEIVWNAVMKAK